MLAALKAKEFPDGQVQVPKHSSIRAAFNLSILYIGILYRTFLLKKKFQVLTLRERQCFSLYAYQRIPVLDTKTKYIYHLEQSTQVSGEINLISMGHLKSPC